MCLLAKEKLCPSRAKVDGSKRKELVYDFGEPKLEIAYEEESKVEPGPEVGEEINTEVKTETVLDAETESPLLEIKEETVAVKE